MPPNSYSLYGLNIRSEIALHAPPGGEGAPDLTILAGEPQAVPAEPAAGELLCRVDYGSGGAAHTRTDTGYTLRYFNTAEFHFNADLTRVTAHTDPAAKADLVPEFLIASVPAFKLLLSGRAVMHASVVARNGKAIGILAQSGGGKSTIAAMLCQQGHAPVTDDVMTLDWRGDAAWAIPGPSELRLRPGSIALDRHSREGGNPILSSPTSRQTSDGRTAVAFAPSAAKPVLLTALITPVLERDGNTASLTRLESSEALATSLGHLRVAGWQDTPALQRIFPEQVRLARQVPCYRLVLPWGPQGLGDAAKLLLNLG